MEIRLHNTLSRSLERFEPLDPGRVTLYVCGPTVYNYAHIGNARPYVVFGLLARLLRRRYPRVVYARNITDVDDKINAAALAAGLPISAITERYTATFHEDMAALGADPPDVEPRATRHIPEIIAMIRALLARGHAYEAEGHVLFSVASFPGYGRLSGRSLEEMIAGARVEVAPFKRHPADFVLWKPSPPELPGWDSPWGRGRPGWHIECSAMSAAHLGDTIDIHAGGVDLVFPHHENEIAQSVCAHDGRPFVRYWLHNGFVTVEGAKMSKSLGNVLLISELRRRWPAEAIRLVLLRAHYRQPLDWSEAAIEQARRTLDRLYGILRELEGIEAAPQPCPAAVEEPLCDDLNTPRALAELSALAERAAVARTPEAKGALLAAGELLGLLRLDPERWFRGAELAPALDEALVTRLVAERAEARRRRDFARADAIRAELAALGVTLEDAPEGTRWRIAS
ncbi:MAG: cysteine--tRNA ligase [Xanthomonadales bacterium]|nr:cysteine--tRNA ligase [Xanthomonadales bacterium]